MSIVFSWLALLLSCSRAVASSALKWAWAVQDDSYPRTAVKNLARILEERGSDASSQAFDGDRDEAFNCAFGALVLYDVSPTPVSSWSVFQRARFLPFLAKWFDRRDERVCAAVAHAPRAVWRLMQEHARRLDVGAGANVRCERAVRACG